MAGNKIIGILQPVYLPWLGYFEQMVYVDQFVIMDDVQYTKRDWRNRNQVKTASGAKWLTVPTVSNSRNAIIKTIDINYEEDWVKRHLRSIEVNYRKCPFFEPLFGEIKYILESKPKKLLELDVLLIKVLCKYLEIETPIEYSSIVPQAAERIIDNEQILPQQMDKKNLRILEICRHFKANLLYDGKSAASFIDVEFFRKKGIEVVFQDYKHPTYRQLFGEFISHQSAIDLIMNTGTEAPAILRSSPVVKMLNRKTELKI